LVWKYYAGDNVVATHTQWKEPLTDLTEALVSTYREGLGLHHLDQRPLPNREVVAGILQDLFDLLFPGFGRRQDLHSRNIEYYIGDMLDSLLDKLSQQIRRALRHGLGDSTTQSELEALAQAKSIAFLNRLPKLRESLRIDVDAAFEGDPAAKTPHEIVFCYPGVEAITIYRIAHELLLLEVPLIPRMMTEYAHSKTGIDVHPGAKIGLGFFIDHGTGVVIGETCIIGNRVKIYQGVTLGALSFPRDEEGKLLRNRKRHPTLEDDVVVYANATILGGDTVIGHHSVIGSSVWLPNSVEPYSVVVLEKPRLSIRGPKWNHADFYSI
jgi:serine O-acetyltransferase